MRFSASEVVVLAEYANLDKSTLQWAIDSCLECFSEEQRETLSDYSDLIYREEIDRIEMASQCFNKDSQPTAPKLGFFTSVLAIFGLGGLFDKQTQSHPYYCTGYCANCPPHYGYRYGCWYYGHGHIHGFEFGGNNGG